MQEAVSVLPIQAAIKIRAFRSLGKPYPIFYLFKLLIANAQLLDDTGNTSRPYCSTTFTVGFGRI